MGFMRYFLAACVFSLTLTACGGGGGDSAPATGTGTGVVTDPPAVQTYAVSGLNGTVSLSYAETWDLNVSGTGNAITVQTANTVRKVTVSGLNNTFTFKLGSTVQTLTISGNGNTIHLPSGVNPTVTDSGTGNQIIHDSTSA